jgi:RNAse (barnase) inhibitor barstar
MSRPEKLVLDFGQIASAEELHDLLITSLKLPNYYGRNWDAFWDVIASGGVLPNQLYLIGWSKFESRLPREAKMMQQCLTDYQNEKSLSPFKVDYT